MHNVVGSEIVGSEISAVKMFFSTVFWTFDNSA